MSFKNVNEPTINELIHWFLVNYPELASDMKNCYHEVQTDEPNPYHIEGDIFAHTMMVCLRAENENSNKIVNICALLHDIGKPGARDVIPFDAKKPSHSESNDIRNKGKNDGETSGLNNFKDRGYKTHFRGHEGLSFYKSIEIVNNLQSKGIINLEEKQEILTIISLHGTLFDSIDSEGNMKKPEKVITKFQDINLYRNFISQVKNDSTGRFFNSKDGRKSNAFKLGKEIFNDNTFIEHTSGRVEKGYMSPIITLLIGLPATGKSTWRNENISNRKIISRDDIMIQYAKDNNIPGNYSEIWKYLEDNNFHKEIDKIEQETFRLAIKDKKDIIIDRTNMSRKSRRKWLSNVPNEYIKEAVVFCTEYDEIYNRNFKRSEETGKSINNYIISNMMKQFIVPMYDEVDKIKWIFN